METKPKSSKPGVFTHVYRRVGANRSSVSPSPSTSSPAPHPHFSGNQDHFVPVNGNPSTSGGPKKNSNSAQGFRGGSCRADVLGFRSKETGNLASVSGFDDTSKRVAGRRDATDDRANKVLYPTRKWTSVQINEYAYQKVSPNASNNTLTASPKMSPKTSNLRLPVAASTMQENCIQDEDEELRKERRREANRESTRRSRLKKQEECNKLQETAQGLKSETSFLRKDLMRLSEECLEFENENKSITEEIIQTYGRGAISDLEAKYPELFRQCIDDKNSNDTEIQSPR